MKQKNNFDFNNNLSKNKSFEMSFETFLNSRRMTIRMQAKCILKRKKKITMIKIRATYSKVEKYKKKIAYLCQ